MEKGSHVGQARGHVEAQATLTAETFVVPLATEAANGCTLRGDSRLLI